MGILLSTETFARSATPFPVAHMRLPPFPQTALKVLQLTQEDNVPLNILGNLISSDTALASEVLMIANSYIYANRFQVRGISQAISVLGMTALKGICLTVGARTYLGKALSKPIMYALWKHNMATALIAEMITGASLMNKSIAYTAGILHDIGRLALGVIQQKEYTNILQTHRGSSASMLECERAAFGLDHCELGERLIYSWKLPREYLDPITNHHAQLDSKRIWTMGEAIKVSCQLADTIGYPAFVGNVDAPYEDLLGKIPTHERMGLPTTSIELYGIIAGKISVLNAH
jgi:putative nucleotidyltransferase with HDIG domain